MFENVIEASDHPAFEGADAVTEEEARTALSHVLDDREEIHHALTSSSGVEHEKDGRNTTIEPGSDHHALCLVTDRRVLFIAGASDDVDPDVSIHISEVEDVGYERSFRNTTFMIRGDGEMVHFKTDQGDVEEVTAYIDRITGNWRGLEAILESTRESLKMYKLKQAEGSDVAGIEQTVESRLNRARAAVNKYVDAPTDLLEAKLEDVVAEFEDARNDDHVVELEEQLDAAATAEDHETTCERLAEVAAGLEEARENVFDDDVAEELDEIEAALDARIDAFLEAAESAREEGNDADPVAAVEHYEESLARYRAANEADVPLPDDDVDVNERARSVAEDLLAALQRKAEQLEASADDGEQGNEDLERAKTALERAQTLASYLPEADETAFEDDIDRLDDAVQRSKWQWGAT